MERIAYEGKIIDPTSIRCPIFIHGEDGSGASQFTITLAANLVASGEKVLFFCTKEQGKENLLEQLGSNYDKNLLTIPQPGSEDDFLATLDSQQEKGWVVVKNIENWGQELLEQVKALPLLVLSGDFNQIKATSFLPEPETRILFSPCGSLGVELPVLEKYVGFLTDGNSSGKIKLEN